jgi:N-acetylglucosaminyldiphosphoundecaprenol N-acetyl-beta-D-mannosaminyltransferase
MSTAPQPDAAAQPIVLLGVPFDNVTAAQTVELIEQMVASRQPHHLVAANVGFLVQALSDIELHRILTDAHLVLAGERPLVWASRLLGNPLPKRVAGADLVPLLLQVAARKKYRVFFLGGTPESTAAACAKLRARHPDLIVAGSYAPPGAPLLEMDHEDICRRIKQAGPDLLFVSFGCPKEEKWIAMHYRSLGVPIAVGVGAAMEAVRGRVRGEPGRHWGRAARNLAVFALAIAQQWWRIQLRQVHAPAGAVTLAALRPRNNWQRIKMPARLDGAAARRDRASCEAALADGRYCLLDLSNVVYIDSTGAGLLLALRQRARLSHRKVILLSPSPAARAALRWMRLEGLFTVAADMAAAAELMKYPAPARPVLARPNYFPWRPSVFWQGEITAANVEQVWRSTQNQIAARAKAGSRFLIDLSALKFIDSAGAWLMLRARESGLQQGLEIVFTGIQPEVSNVLHFARAESVLPRPGGVAGLGRRHRHRRARVD